MIVPESVRKDWVVPVDTTFIEIKTQLDEQRALHETTRADMDSTKADLETIKTDLVTLQAATVNVDLDHLITQITLLQNVVFSLTKRLEALEQA